MSPVLFLSKISKNIFNWFLRVHFPTEIFSSSNNYFSDERRRQRNESLSDRPPHVSSSHTDSEHGERGHKRGHSPLRPDKEENNNNKSGNSTGNGTLSPDLKRKRYNESPVGHADVSIWCKPVFSFTTSFQMKVYLVIYSI